MSWEQLASKKRQQLADSIPKEWIIPDGEKPGDDVLDVSEWSRTSKWFTDEEQAITSKTATELLQKLGKGDLSAEAVTRAFSKKAAAAQQLTNCLSETLFDAAIARARSLDQHLREYGTPVGPLHGLPISLKDNFYTAGTDSTVGFAIHIDHPASQDAALVEVLRSLGAVFYVKTNVPTAMMIAESVNNVFGRTLNPLNRRLTSGGSSGGESALLAFGASPLGVGTDIGGSLRIPAACTGIFTLRPSFGRFPTLGCRPGLAGQEAVQSVNGPMARDLDALSVFAAAVVAAEPWRLDPRCLPIPWRGDAAPAHSSSGRLKIGVFCDDGIVRPTPPVQRAWREAVAKLRRAGHEVVEWDVGLHRPLLETLGRFFLADGGKTVRAAIEPTGEPFRPEMRAYETAAELGTHDMWQLQLERTGLQKAYLDQWRAAGGLDALLGPTTPFAAPQHGNFKHVGFTGVFNVLDYSCVSFPSGVRADKEKDVYDGGYEPLSETCRQIHDEYDADAVHGMPVSLQLIAQRLEDEKVLAMTKTVLEALNS